MVQNRYLSRYPCYCISGVVVQIFSVLPLYCNNTRLFTARFAKTGGQLALIPTEPVPNGKCGKLLVRACLVMNPATKDLHWETYLNKYADFPELIPLR